MPAHFGFMDFLIKLSQEVGKSRDGGKDGTVSFAQKHLNEGGESVYYRTHDDIHERSFLGKKKKNIHNGFAQIMECAQSKPADVLFGSRDKCNDFPAQL